MACKNRGICGFLGPSWVLITMPPVKLYIVDNAGRHGIDFGSEGLVVNDLSFFSYEHINESF